mmetsp:Transcript_14719/g.39757  ORF Transcript_14719/g.39757 Transcript_14719/m.39757 type:complete len:214 (+) Transcript_14719:1-642(+)
MGCTCSLQIYCQHRHLCLPGSQLAPVAGEGTVQLVGHHLRLLPPSCHQCLLRCHVLLSLAHAAASRCDSGLQARSHAADLGITLSTHVGDLLAQIRLCALLGLPGRHQLAAQRLTLSCIACSFSACCSASSFQLRHGPPQGAQLQLQMLLFQGPLLFGALHTPGLLLHLPHGLITLALHSLYPLHGVNGHQAQTALGAQGLSHLFLQCFELAL